VRRSSLKWSYKLKKQTIMLKDILFIILFIAGLVALIKGRIKVSANKEIVRPHSIYLGVIFIICAIALSFLKLEIPYDLIVFIFPLLITIVFAAMGRSIDTPEAIKEKKETKRNVLILLAFIILVVGVFYFYFLIT